MTDTRLPRGLYAITPEPLGDDPALLMQVRAALEGGAVMVQYRAKARATRALAYPLAGLCRDFGARFIINDDIALAQACGAHGVHLGRDDVSPAEARRQLGAQAIIGVSCCNDAARAQTAVQAGADYVAFGAFFPSRTKPQAAVAALDLLAMPLPVAKVAIGGVTPQNGAPLICAGAQLLAAVEGVFGTAPSDAETIRAAARAYADLFTAKEN